MQHPIYARLPGNELRWIMGAKETTELYDRRVNEGLNLKLPGLSIVFAQAAHPEFFAGYNIEELEKAIRDDGIFDMTGMEEKAQAAFTEAKAALQPA